MQASLHIPHHRRILTMRLGVHAYPTRTSTGTQEENTTAFAICTDSIIALIYRLIDVVLRWRTCLARATILEWTQW